MKLIFCKKINFSKASSNYSTNLHLKFSPFSAASLPQDWHGISNGWCQIFHLHALFRIAIIWRLASICSQHSITGMTQIFVNVQNNRKKKFRFFRQCVYRGDPPEWTVVEVACPCETLFQFQLQVCVSSYEWSHWCSPPALPPPLPCRDLTESAED